MTLADRLRRLPRSAVGGAAVTLAVLSAAVAAAGIRAATADDTSGQAVPPEQLAVIKAAATACPALSGPRLAGQLMATSGFNPDATTDFGGSGIAGLTADAWSRWAPSSTASRSDVTANIVALAHDMCDLVGELRVDGVEGDEWRNALGAFHSGTAAVVNAGGVPGSAASYVDKVAAYTAWYALRPEFGGPGATSAPATATVPAPLTPAAPVSSAATRSGPAPRPSVPVPGGTATPTGGAAPVPPAGASPTTPAPARTPEPPPPAGHPIVGEESSRCVDVVGGSHTPGTAVDIWDCAGVDNQQWVVADGRISVYGGTMCLDAPSTASMTRVVVRPCDGSPGQRWSVNGDHTVTSVPSGECLDATGYVTDNGTPLQIWPCNGAANERWNID